MSFYRNSLFMALCFILNIPNVFAHHQGGYEPTSGIEAKSGETISSGAMINSPTASTLGRNHFNVGFTFDYLRYNSIPAANAHRLHHQGHDVHGKNHEETYNMGVGYGVLGDLDLFLVSPIVSKNTIEVEDHETLGKKESAMGFGDMRLIGKYRFWKRYIESAFIAGIKFPTGKTSIKKKSGDKFEPEQQPGSGSWDGEFGIVFSRSFKKRISAATSFQYLLKGEGAQELKQGDAFRCSAGGGFSLREFGKYPNASFTVEFNNEWALKDRSRTEKHVLDSGGTVVFVTSGFSLNFTKNVSAFWSMPVPIYQNLGGEHEELKFEMLSGINFYF